MRKEETISNFVNTLVLLSRQNNLIGDKFFSDKFGNKIYYFAESFVVWQKGNKANVAQYKNDLEKVIRNLEELLEELESLNYLKFISISPLFFEVEKNLLNLKLNVIKSKAIEQNLVTENIPENLKELKKEAKISFKNPVTPQIKLNQSQKKILEFIKSSPDIRTKDIISEFSVLSDRTVKRNLTDLLHSGFIKKRVDNKAVYYYSNDNKTL